MSGFIIHRAKKIQNGRPKVFNWCDEFLFDCFFCTFQSMMLYSIIFLCWGRVQTTSCTCYILLNVPCRSTQPCRPIPCRFNNTVRVYERSHVLRDSCLESKQLSPNLSKLWITEFSPVFSSGIHREHSWCVVYGRPAPAVSETASSCIDLRHQLLILRNVIGRTAMSSWSNRCGREPQSCSKVSA